MLSLKFSVIALHSYCLNQDFQDDVRFNPKILIQTNEKDQKFEHLKYISMV